MEYSLDQVRAIMIEAESEAYAAAHKYFHEQLGGQDRYACGFAWVNIYGIRGNTRLGKTLKAAGIHKDYTGAHQIWNPARFGCQNVDTLYEGAKAAAKVFEKYGFRAYAGSRLD